MILKVFLKYRKTIIISRVAYHWLQCWTGARWTHQLQLSLLLASLLTRSSRLLGSSSSAVPAAASVLRLEATTRAAAATRLVQAGV